MNKIILFCTLGVLLLSCTEEKFEARSDNRFLMGTVCIITLYSGEPQEIFDRAFSLIEREELRMSLQKGNSELSRINERAGIEKLQVSDDIYQVIKTSLLYSQISRGAFDPTIAPLVELWGIGQDFTSVVPPEPAINSKRELIDYRKVLLGENRSVFLAEKGMRIDLGGIAKGYIADKVKEFLISEGVERGIINLGGNIIVLGSKLKSQPWNIGIQNPFDSRGNHIGIASVTDKTIVTSGIYERYFLFEGKRYHHILDPLTGYPVENDLASVTIIADRSIDADALSTTLFILGLKEGIKLTEKIENSEAIFVTKEKDVIYSSGAGALFALQHNDFTQISMEDYITISQQ